jgi:hypothetical protein
VVLRGKANVLDACIHKDPHPFLGIEVDGVELLDQVLIVSLKAIKVPIPLRPAPNLLPPRPI